MAMDCSLASFSEAACKADRTRVTPYGRWDADSSLASISHRLGARFGRCHLHSSAC